MARFLLGFFLTSIAVAGIYALSVAVAEQQAAIPVPMCLSDNCA